MGAGLPYDDLAEPWRLNEEQAFWFSRSAWSLHVVCHWWQTANAGRKPVVWLPGYFCNQSTEPMRRTGAELVHYPVTDDLEPDWNAVEKLVSKGPSPDLFMLTHYFGHAADGEAAAAFCQQMGALLIEDSAHVFLPSGGIGKHGDFLLYSPHKVLPIPSIGLLMVRSPDLAQEIEGSFQVSLAQRYENCKRWIFVRSVQKILPDFVLAARNRKLPGFEHDPPYVELPTAPFPNPIAVRMLAKIRGRLPDIGQQRKTSARNWRRFFEGMPDAGSPFFSENEEGPCPYRYVQKFSDLETASKWFGYFRTAGIPVESWPDLAPQVIADTENHTSSKRLRDSLLLFPTNRGYNPSPKGA